MEKALEINVFGRVQGVGFRFFVQRKARIYGVKGYVKNVVNGSVKIVAIGEELAMQHFIKKVKIGPDYSWVADVKMSELTNYEDYQKFTIK